MIADSLRPGRLSLPGTAKAERLAFRFHYILFSGKAQARGKLNFSDFQYFPLLL